MRVLLVVLALTVACAAAVFAAGTNTSSSSSSMNQPSGIGAGSMTGSTGDQVVDACVGRCMNISAQQIQSMRAQGFTNSDIAMAAAISMRSGKPLSDVVSNYQRSKDWNQVASSYGLSMSDLASAPVIASSPDAESFNTAFVSQYYAIPQSQITQLRRQGYSWEDINLMANAAVRTGQPITQIASLRGQGLTWADIAARYNVACNTLISPVPAVSVTTAMVPTTGVICPPTGAGPITAARVPVPVICGPCVIYDRNGNPILTYDQAINLYANGHDWLDVAVAANIARYEGVPILTILQMEKGIGNWQEFVYQYGIPANVAFNVADYPYPQISTYPSSVNESNLRAIESYQQPGVYPSCTTPPPSKYPPLCNVTPPCPGTVICPAPCPPATGPTCPPGFTPAPGMTPSTTPGTGPMVTPTAPPQTVPTPIPGTQAPATTQPPSSGTY